MIAPTHIVAGAAAGAVCRRARVAVPVAFVSHFVLDLVPHSCFNVLPAAAGIGWSGKAVVVGMVAGYAIALWAMVLAWRLPTRWVSVAAAVAAFAPDPLCYLPPIKGWFALLPGSAWVAWVHNTFHCDVTLTHLTLGFATQAAVMAICLYILARKRPKPLDKIT